MEQLNDLLSSSLNQKVISSRTGGGAGAIWLIKYYDLVYLAYRTGKSCFSYKYR